MVAASKLRRAQTAAEAARPYAEKMDAVIANIARRRRLAAAAGAAGRHRQGSGASAAGLHRRARPVRRLQLVDRASRPRARAGADEPGQEVKFFCVGRKGYEQLRRKFEKQIVETCRAALGAPARLRQCRGHRQEGHRAFRGRRVRRLHAVLFALQVGDRADPDRAADHPARSGRAGRQRRSGDRPTNTSRKRTKSSTACCRAISRCRFSARCWKTTPRSTARR